MPTITVVIPVYNGGNYLEEALQSVLNQTYQDFEVLVVDDGSTDNTWGIIEQYCATHGSVVRGLRKANGGTATALNAGIRAAEGKYIAWLSHDDRFVPNKLAVQMQLIHSTRAAGVYSDYNFIDAAGNHLSRVYAPWYPPAQMLRHFLQSVFINGSTLLIERRCLLEGGLFDEGLRYAHDAYMWAYLIQNHPLAHSPVPLTDYRTHSQQGTKRWQAIRRDSQLWLSKVLQHYSIQDIFPELDSPHVRPAHLAAAHNYLGDVMTMRHWHYDLGLAQYWQSWRAWPSLRNPVVGKLNGALWRACVKQTRALRNARRHSLGQQELPPVIDLRNWSNSIPGVNFGSET
jgi:glycosyltransferase involved in cell wall biosynthesis